MRTTTGSVQQLLLTVLAPPPPIAQPLKPSSRLLAKMSKYLWSKRCRPHETLDKSKCVCWWDWRGSCLAESCFADYLRLLKMPQQSDWNWSVRVRACVRVCVLLWGYFPRWLRKSALWFIGAEEPCGYSSHARGDACLSAITASAHYVLIVAASSVLYKQKTAYFLVFAVVRVLCCFACQSDDVGLKNMFALL